MNCFTAINTFSYQCPLSNYKPTFRHTSKCSSAYTLQCGIKCCTFGNTGHADRGLSFRHNFYVVCICYLFQFSVFVLHSTGICLISLDSQENVSYSPLICITIYLIYSPCINLLPRYFFKISWSRFCMSYAFFFCHCFHLFGLILIQPFVAVSIVEFIFG